MSAKSTRPMSSYGRERKGSARPDRQREAEKEKRNNVKKIEQKNTATEYSFNRHAKVKEELCRQKSDRSDRGSRHHGDENLHDEDLAQSMPERMMRLTVGDARKRDLSPSSTGSNSPLRRSFDKGMDSVGLGGDASPVLIRSHTIGGDRDRGRRNSKAEVSNAKLAMMKKRLSPLPSRERLDSFDEPRSREHSPSRYSQY